METEGCFMKRFLIISLAFAVILVSAFFIAEKFFPAETYIAKSFITDFSKKSFPAPENENLEESCNLSELLKNGAVLNDSLLLINEEHPFPEDYSPELVDLGGVFVNSCAEDAYRKLSKDIKDFFNNSLYIMSAFRTREEQEKIIEAGNEFAVSVNSSEHLSGLALDVYVKYHAGMGFIDSEEGQFVNSFCQNYGFIIRYPYYGEKITGIPFEPWHLRYVGLPHSKIIAENNLTLEEYIESYLPGEIYYYDEYFISRQKSEEIFIPEGFSEIIISPDNTGYYFITGKQ